MNDREFLQQLKLNIENKINSFSIAADACENIYQYNLKNGIKNPYHQHQLKREIREYSVIILQLEDVLLIIEKWLNQQ